MSPQGTDTITRYELVRDHGLNEQVLRLTPSQWREKSAIERRLLLAFTERRLKVLGEKYAFIIRNMSAEPALPECWRKEGIL